MTAHTGANLRLLALDEDGSVFGAIVLQGLVVDRDARTLDAGHFDVRNFGAVSGQDCTAAFLACITAAKQHTQGASIHVPAGHWKVAADTLTLYTATDVPLYIFGDGYHSHIEWTGSGDNGFNGQSSKCHIEGIRFTGTITHAVIFSRPSSTNISDCVVEGCWFEGVGNRNAAGLNAAIYFEGVDRAQVTRSTFSGNGIAGVPGVVSLTDTSNAPRTFVAGELIFYDGTTAYRNNASISLGALATVSVPVSSVLANSSSAAASVTVVKTFSTGVALANATCTNAAAIANSNPVGYEILFGATDDHYGSSVTDCSLTMTNSIIGICNFNGVGFLARGNTVDGGGALNGAWSEGGNGILCYEQALHTVSRCIVANNTVTNCAGSGIYVQGFEDATVSGNTVEECALRLDGVSLAAGNIAISSADRVTVSGNTVTGGEKDGIVVATGLHCSVTGNIVSDVGQIGINARGVASYMTIQGNTVTTGNHGIYGASALVGMTVSGNTLYGQGGEGIGFENLSDSTIGQNIVKTAASHAVYIAAGARTAIRGNTVNSTSGPDIYYLGTDGKIEGNVVNPTGTTAINVTASCSVTDNRIVSGNIVAAAGAYLRGNRYSSTAATSGTATLSSGTVNVASAEILAGDTIRLSRSTPGGAPGHLSWTVPSAGNLTINSSSGTDNGTVLWEVLH